MGMKKQFPTVLHASALEQETIVVSGGRIGVQVELQLEVLRALCCGLLRRMSLQRHKLLTQSDKEAEIHAG